MIVVNVHSTSIDGPSQLWKGVSDSGIPAFLASAILNQEPLCPPYCGNPSFLCSRITICKHNCFKASLFDLHSITNSARQWCQHHWYLLSATARATSQQSAAQGTWHFTNTSRKTFNHWSCIYNDGRRGGQGRGGEDHGRAQGCNNSVVLSPPHRKYSPPSSPLNHDPFLVPCLLHLMADPPTLLVPNLTSVTCA